MISTLSVTAKESGFPKTTLVLWRDERDPEQITIGSITKVQRAFGCPPRYTAWLTCHLDALLFLADKRMYDRIRDAQPAEFPMPVELSITLPALEGDE